jgi:hypothetical protein
VSVVSDYDSAVSALETLIASAQAASPNDPEGDELMDARAASEAYRAGRDALQALKCVDGSPTQTRAHLVRQSL